MAPHRCPYCLSHSVRRSRRRGFGEQCFLRLVFVRPYRCRTCCRRHYGLTFLVKSNDTGAYESAWASLYHAIPQPAPTVAGLVAVLLVLGSTNSNLLSLGLGGVPATAGERPTSGIPVTGPPAAAATPQLGPVNLADREVAPKRNAPKVPAGQTRSEPVVLARASFPPKPQQAAMGTLRAVGEVVLNGTPVPQTATFFAGDTLRTGSNGSAALQFADKGMIEVSPQTLLRFTKSTRYVAEITYGRVTSRSLPQTTNFQVRAGNFIVVPDPERPEMIAEITRGLDGAVTVKSVQGSVGVIELEGAQTTFIRTGQAVSISTEGKLLTNASSPASSAAPLHATRSGGGHGALIGLGVGGAAAAGIGIALADSGGNSSPVSRSAP